MQADRRVVDQSAGPRRPAQHELTVLGEMALADHGSTQNGVSRQVVGAPHREEEEVRRIHLRGVDGDQAPLRYSSGHLLQRPSQDLLLRAAELPLTRRDRRFR